MAINATRAKDFNRSRVLNAIRRGNNLSRNEIAEEIGLTPPAVGNLVSELIRDGLVRELGRRSPQRGQPPIELELCPEGAYALGLLLERSLIAGVLVNLAGEVIAQRELQLETTPSPKEALQHLTAIVKELNQLPYSTKLLGVGLATFGPLDLEAGTISTPQFSDEWIKIPLRDQLAEATGLTVYLDNDATAAAIGEYWYGFGRDYPNYLYINFCDGLGGGLFMHGRAYRGASLNAAELGHFLVTYEAKTIFLEEVVSLQAFAKRLEFGGHPLIELEQRFARQDKALFKLLDESARLLAQVVSSIDHLLDLDAIILGGQASKALFQHLLDLIVAYAEPFRMKGKTHRCQFVLGQTGAQGAALGAASLPLYDTFVRPARMTTGQVFSSSQEEVMTEGERR
ncbi:MAG: ROK family transcriptional regulator [Trueperaceae bacterium]|nr:ROK family transcriptional regulator [Trueperaceae bacterium]